MIRIKLRFHSQRQHVQPQARYYTNLMSQRIVDRDSDDGKLT